MKLLICTQKVNKDDPILGFFHQWLLEYAKQCESVHVICLEEGSHNLPLNVVVHSLGKDKGRGKFSILVHFFQLIWKYRKHYDGVFVHMNQIYILLGGLLWKMLGKKMALWYAHGSVTTSLRMAVALADRCFTSTDIGLRIVTPKKRVVGHGIDTAMFVPVTPKEFLPQLRLGMVGRLSPVKNFETAIDTVAILANKSIDTTLSIIGGPGTDKQKTYETFLRNHAQENGIGDKVLFLGDHTNHEVAALLLRVDASINTSLTGSLDKTMMEALSCGIPVFSCNPNLKILLANDLSIDASQFIFEPKNAKELAEKLANFSMLSTSTKAELSQKCRNIITQHYTIEAVVGRIVNEYRIILST